MLIISQSRPSDITSKDTRGLNISASYDFGLPNVTVADHWPDFKHRVLRVSLGYSFRLDD